MLRFVLTAFSTAAILSATLPPQAATAQNATYLAGVVQNPVTDVPPVQVVARAIVPRLSGGVNDFSGIASSDGTNVLLLSDHGFIASVRLVRGYGQQIDRVDLMQVVVLRDEAGLPLHGARQDAEGIAVGRDGSIYVSFEQHDRVMRYRHLGGPAEALGGHGDFSRLRAGRGLEALAVAPDGALYAVPERPARATYGFPSYRLAGGEWTGSFRLPEDGQFLPVGADYGPDGMLYVLEREQGVRGYRSQVRRFGVRGRAIVAPQVVMRSEPGQFGNLEGISVFRDRTGRIRLLMVEDDDLGRGQSELVDVALNR